MIKCPYIIYMDNQLIGIVTWPKAANPGTVFQAYALQQFINRIPTLKAEVINYKYIPPSKKKQGLLRTILKPFLRWRYNKIVSFSRKIVKFPQERMLNHSELYLVNERYDQFILGSDQIWNVNFTGFDKTFFLDFVKNKRKGAYAPSIGRDDWPEECKDEIRQLLADFSFIGVREKGAVDVVQPLTDKPVHWSLDSTFLFSKSDWELVAKPFQQKGDYIFVYSIMKTQSLRAVAERLSKMTRLPIIEHCGIRKLVPTAKRIPNRCADTWLSYLMNAKYVVTDSFHGCAFSINTNRTFFVVVTANGSRIYSILELFGLEDRIVNNIEDIDLSKNIDWDSVNIRLEDRRKESQDWLKSSLIN